MSSEVIENIHLVDEVIECELLFVKFPQHSFLPVSLTSVLKFAHFFSWTRPGLAARSMHTLGTDVPVFFPFLRGFSGISVFSLCPPLFLHFLNLRKHYDENTNLCEHPPAKSISGSELLVYRASMMYLPVRISAYRHCAVCAYTLSPLCYP